MRRTRRRGQISLTSLIDVIFLLLLFFMLTSTFTKFAEIELSVGGSGAVAAAELPPIFLRLGPETLSVNGQPAEVETLADTLRAALSHHGADADTPRRVIVALARDVTAQRLTDLLGAMRSVPGIAPTVLGRPA